jgi:hypothetical protein
MKNNFDLKGYMKENKVGAYQQLNEMWYSDMQAIGQPLGMRHTAINEEEETIEEAAGDITMVIDYNTAPDDIQYVSRILKNAGIKGKVKVGWNDEEIEITVNQADKEKLEDALIDQGFEARMADELEEKGDVKSIGDAGKMAHANTRTNLARHRSSDMLDKISKKDHDKNTVIGAKAAAYKAPHMKEEETADDIFAGSDTAKSDNYGNETSEWDTEIAGQTVKGWTAEETQGGAIAWQNPRYPNAHIYATPGWDGVDGIAFELHDSEDGYMDEPKLQKVVGSGTDLWKTKEGYMALMAKAFTAVEKMLTPSDNMDEDYMGTQYGSSEDMAVDMLKKGITEDEDPFGSIKTSIDKITRGDDEDMSDEDRIMSMGGDQIKAGIQSLLDDGFDYRQILDLVKNAIKATRKGGVN